jgi:hypothetical protein
LIVCESCEQLDAVGVRRPCKERPSICELDNFAPVHDRNSIAKVSGNADVAGDEQH